MNIHQLNAFAALPDIKHLADRFTKQRRDKILSLPILEISAPVGVPETGDLKGPVYPVVYKQGEAIPVKCYADDKELVLEPEHVLTFAALIDRLRGGTGDNYQHHSYRLEINDDSFGETTNVSHPDQNWYTVSAEIELVFWLMSRFYRGHAEYQVYRTFRSDANPVAEFSRHSVVYSLLKPELVLGQPPVEMLQEEAAFLACQRAAFQLELLRKYLGYGEN